MSKLNWDNLNNYKRCGYTAGYSLFSDLETAVKPIIDNHLTSNVVIIISNGTLNVQERETFITEIYNQAYEKARNDILNELR